MAIAGPRRRRGDARRPQPVPVGPTPGALGPADPAEVRRSIEHALEASRRQRRPLTLVALEVHAAAEPSVLARVASLVRRTVRETDVLWRDGEASLVLLLVDADGPNAEPALARLRLRLRSEGLREAVMMGRAAPPPGLPADELMFMAHTDCRPI